jgi:hypothetical protein
VLIEVEPLQSASWPANRSHTEPSWWSQRKPWKPGGGVTAGDLLGEQDAEHLGGLPPLGAGGCKDAKSVLTNVFWRDKPARR